MKRILAPRIELRAQCMQGHNTMKAFVTDDSSVVVC